MRLCATARAAAALGVSAFVLEDVRVHTSNGDRLPRSSFRTHLITFQRRGGAEIPTYRPGSQYASVYRVLCVKTRSTGPPPSATEVAGALRSGGRPKNPANRRCGCKARKRAGKSAADPPRPRHRPQLRRRRTRQSWRGTDDRLCEVRSATDRHLSPPTKNRAPQFEPAPIRFTDQPRKNRALSNPPAFSRQGSPAVRAPRAGVAPAYVATSLSKGQ